MPFVAIVALACASAVTPPQQPDPRSHRAGAAEPLLENRGQWPDAAAFGTHAGGTAAWCTAAGLVLAVTTFAPPASGPGAGKGRAEPLPTGGASLRLRFADATSAPHGELPQPGVHHCWRGDAGAMVGDVRGFARARHAGVWPGIDVLVTTRDGGVAYDLELAADADLARVRFAADGAESVRLDADGRLVLATAAGDCVQSAPVAWYVLPDGRHEPVGCRFRRDGEHGFGFVLAGERRPLPLVVDPTIHWSTLLGGFDVERPWGIARDPNTGYLHTAGVCWSANFPRTVGPAYGGSRDVFVSVLDPATNALLWSSTYGNGGDEWAAAVDVDAGGNTLIVGATSAGGIPTTTGAFQATAPGGFDGFAMVLAPGGALVAATYLGSTGSDFVAGGRFDGNGDAVVLGCTNSAALATPGAFQTTFRGGVIDHFVLRWAPRQSGAAQRVWCTLLGGNGDDGWFTGVPEPANMNLGDVLVAGDGSVWACGRTSSNNFPTTPGCYQAGATPGGVYADAFVAHFDATGSALLYCTLVGSTSDDVADVMTLHPDGGVVLAGLTWGSFPYSGPLANSWTLPYRGQNDAIAFWIDPSRPGAQQLRYCTQVGGAQYDYFNGVAVDGAGIWTLAGTTYTSNPKFPTTPGCYQAQQSASYSGTVLRLHAGEHPVSPAADLYYSSFLGLGTVNFGTSVNGVAIDAHGVAALALETDDAGYVTTPGAPYRTYAGGNCDSAVTVFDPLPAGVERQGPDTPACAAAIPAGASATPARGTPGFAVHALGGPPTTLAVLLAGVPATVPVPIGNAVGLLDPATSVLLALTSTDARGFVQQGIPVAAGIAPGTQVSLQWGYLTTPTCGGSGPFAASQRLDLTVQ